jgi:excisionase family DNA binding protein
VIELNVLRGMAVYARQAVLDREYFTTTEFARLFGVSRSTVARLVDRGRIPARRVGSHRRIFKADLEAAGLLMATTPARPDSSQP